MILNAIIVPGLIILGVLAFQGIMLCISAM
jgi:hypothetical protein